MSLDVVVDVVFICTGNAGGVLGGGTLLGRARVSFATIASTLGCLAVGLLTLGGPKGLLGPGVGIETCFEVGLGPGCEEVVVVNGYIERLFVDEDAVTELFLVGPPEGEEVTSLQLSREELEMFHPGFDPCTTGFAGGAGLDVPLGLETDVIGDGLKVFSICEGGVVVMAEFLAERVDIEDEGTLTLTRFRVDAGERDLGGVGKHEGNT